MSRAKDIFIYYRCVYEDGTGGENNIILLQVPPIKKPQDISNIQSMIASKHKLKACLIVSWQRLEEGRIIH